MKNQFFQDMEMISSVNRVAVERMPGSDPRLSTAWVQLFMTAALVASIAIAAIAVSIGYARAESAGSVVAPDAGLVLALMLGAVGVMGLASAVAVRWAGRPRQHS